MKTQISTKVAMTAAIVMGWTWLTALQCGDPGISPPTVQGCSVGKDTDFPATGSVTLNKPQKCPLNFYISTNVPYAATADLPAGSVAYHSYQNEVVTWNGYHNSFIANTVWSEGNGRWFVNITGEYIAGQGGFDSYNSGWDDIRNGFYTNHWTYGWTRITYQYGAPASSNAIAAPDWVEPYQQYSVSASLHDAEFVSPVTYSWYVNNELVGTSSDGQYAVYAGEPWATQQLYVEATDTNGHTVTGGYRTVSMTSGCPNRQDVC